MLFRSGLDSDVGRAFATAQIQAGNSLPTSGCVLVSVRRDEHEQIVEPIRALHEAGFRVLATDGTAKTLNEHGIPAVHCNKVYEGSPHTADAIEAGEVDLVINTVDPNPLAIRDSYSMRRAALQRGTPYCTTLAAARASASAIRALEQGSIGVRSLQEIHEQLGQ